MWLHFYKIISDRELNGLGYFFALICKLGEAELIISMKVLIQHFALFSVDTDKIQCSKPIYVCRYI